MKRVLLLLVFGFLIFGMLANFPLIIADDNPNPKLIDNSDEEKRNGGEINKEFTDERGRRIRVERKVEMKNGEEKVKIKRAYIDEDGNEREIEIVIERENGRRKIKIEGVEGLDVDTELELEDEFEGNESELRVVLSNGEKANIKIMPDQLIEIALERLRAQNFTMELKEVKYKGKQKAIYNIEANKTGRFIGIFKLKLKLEGQIDPETGEVIGIGKPWWAFMVTGEDSDQIGKKVTLCHIPQGNPSAAHTISVGAPAMNAHVNRHGDTLGACEGEEGNETSPPTNETGDTESPLWFDNSTNSTINGTLTEYSIRWTDNVSLSGYIFGFDNGTGSFVNDSFVSMSGAEDWSNVTKFVNSTADSVIRWIVYANDTSDNWNMTNTFNYNITS